MKKAVTIVLVLLMICSSAVSAFAGEKDQITNQVGVDSVSKLDSSDYFDVTRPYSNQVFYVGEKMRLVFEMYDAWSYYYSEPWMGVFDYNDNLISDVMKGETADEDQWNSYDWKESLKGIPAGKYHLIMFCVPVDEYGYSVDGWDEWDNVPQVDIPITIRKLKCPASVSVKRGRRKATITFKKSTGASKYEIYRSTKKSSGFKKVKTTNSRKFVDKKVKKGKTYYYKVRSVRTVSGTIRSSFSKAKSSGKIK